MRITSGVFRFLNNALGLFGDGSQTTDIDDANVSQVLDISNIAAYSQAIGGNAGILMSNLAMIHAAAGDIQEEMDPYNPGTKVAPFDAVELDDFDMWYLGAACTLISSSQTIDEVQGAMFGPSLSISEGAQRTHDAILTRWDTVVQTAGGETVLVLAINGLNFQPPSFPFLWPRGATYQVNSQTTGVGATTLDVWTMWCITQRGLRPSAF